MQQNAETQETQMLWEPWSVVTSTLCHVTVMIVIEHLTVACSAGAALVNDCPDSLGPKYLRLRDRGDGYEVVDPENYVTKGEFLKSFIKRYPNNERQKTLISRSAFDPRRPNWYCQPFGQIEDLAGMIVTVKGKSKGMSNKDQPKRYLVQKVWKLACFVKSGM